MTGNNNSKKSINKKQMIISIIIFIVLFSFYGVFLFKNDKNKNTSIEISKKMASPKIYDGLNITDIEAFNINGNYQIRINIKNNTSHDYEAKSVFLVFLNKSGDVTEKKGFSIPHLKSGENFVSIYVLPKERFKDYTFLISDK